MSTGSTKPTIYNAQDARAIATVMQEMKSLSDDLLKSGQEIYLKGEVRVWNTNGYSLGVVKYVDDFWIFEFDYEEV